MARLLAASEFIAPLVARARQRPHQPRNVSNRPEMYASSDEALQDTGCGETFISLKIEPLVSRSAWQSSSTSSRHTCPTLLSVVLVCKLGTRLSRSSRYSRPNSALCTTSTFIAVHDTLPETGLAGSRKPRNRRAPLLIIFPVQRQHLNRQNRTIAYRNLCNLSTFSTQKLLHA